MIDINSIENILIGIVLFFLALYTFASVVESKPHWFHSKTFMKTRKMQESYDKMVESRRQMLHHYYWNKSSNNKSQMKKIQKQVIKLDKEMQQIRSEYELVRKGLPIPLKMF